MNCNNSLKVLRDAMHACTEKSEKIHVHLSFYMSCNANWAKDAYIQHAIECICVFYVFELKILCIFRVTSMHACIHVCICFILNTTTREFLNENFEEKRIFILWKKVKNVMLVLNFILCNFFSKLNKEKIHSRDES